MSGGGTSGGGMRDEIVAYKRERILQEAVALFYEHGFTATTLDDIAARLGVTKPFIYTHFKSKTDLLAAICRPTIAMALAAVEDAVALPGTHVDKLRAAVIDFTQVILLRQANIAVFFREEKSLSPEDAAEINALRKRFDHQLSRLLEDGAAAGEFTVDDPRLAALAIGGMVSWAYTWVRPHGRLDPETLSSRMANLALRMVGVAVPLTG